MAHNQKKQSSGSWKNKRDSHQKSDRNTATTQERRSKPSWNPMGKKTKSKKCFNLDEKNREICSILFLILFL